MEQISVPQNLLDEGMYEDSGLYAAGISPGGLFTNNLDAQGNPIPYDEQTEGLVIGGKYMEDQPHQEERELQGTMATVVNIRLTPEEQTALRAARQIERETDDNTNVFNVAQGIRARAAKMLTPELLSQLDEESRKYWRKYQ